MDIIKKFKEEIKKEELKPKTIKNYISDLNTVLDIFDYTSNFLKTPEETIKTLQKHYPNVKTLATKINIIIMLLKLNYKDDEELQKFNKTYLVFRNQLKNENEEYYKQQIANPKQIEKSITCEENEKIKNVLLSRIKHLTKDRTNITNIRNYLIYMFLDYLNCRGDFINSLLVIENSKNEYDKQYNYIIINKTNKTIKYIQNNYKTNGVYKQLIHDIDNGTYKYFIKLYNGYKKLGIETKYCFNQTDLLNPMNVGNLSTLYKQFGIDILGKVINIQVMRVQKASNDYEIMQPILNKSKNMSHSIGVHSNVYMKKNICKI